jgi:hypothetical protein
MRAGQMPAMNQLILSRLEPSAWRAEHSALQDEAGHPAHKKSAAQCLRMLKGTFWRRFETARQEIVARELGAGLARR